MSANVGTANYLVSLVLLHIVVNWKQNTGVNHGLAWETPGWDRQGWELKYLHLEGHIQIP